MADVGDDHPRDVLTVGTSRSVPAFVAKLDKTAQALGDNRPAVQKTAEKGRDIFISTAALARVGRGVGKTKVSKSVSAKVKLSGGAHDPSATIQYTGQAHLLNNPTKPHEIRPRKFVGTRGTAARAQKGAALMAAFGLDARSPGRGGIVIPGVGIRRGASHPGTKGLHFAEKAKASCHKVLPGVYMKAGVVDPLKAVLK